MDTSEGAQGVDAKVSVEQSEGKRHVTVDLRDVKRDGTCLVPQGDSYSIIMKPGMCSGGGIGRKGNVLLGNGIPAATFLQPPHEWMQRPLGASRFGWWLAGLLGLRRRWLEGPIYVGDEFILEPDKPHAREHVRVSRVFWNGRENTIQCTWKDGHYPYISDEARFREACVRKT